MALEKISRQVTVKDSLDQYETDFIKSKNIISQILSDLGTLRSEINTNASGYYDNPEDLAFIDSKIDVVQAQLNTLNNTAQALN